MSKVEINPRLSLKTFKNINMDPTVQSALVSAGASLGNSIFSSLGIGLGKQRREQEKYARQIRVWDREDAERDWRWQNEWRDNDRAYNAPTAVKERLLQAGLSPYLAYGSGGSGVGAGSSAQTMHPSGSHSSGSAAIQAAQLNLDPDMLNRAKLADAQANEMNAHANKLRSETGNPEDYVAGMKLSNELLSRKIVGQDIANGLAAIDKDIADATKDDKINFSHVSVKQAEQNLSNLVATYDEIKSRTNLNTEEAAKTAEEKNLITRKIDEMALIMALHQADLTLKDAELKNLNQLFFIYAQQRREVLASARLKEAQTEVAKETVNKEKAQTKDIERANTRFYVGLATDFVKDVAGYFVPGVSKLLNGAKSSYSGKVRTTYRTNGEHGTETYYNYYD